MRRPVYLDYMATTPVDPAVIDKMQLALGYESAFGNPASGTHSYGWEAARLVGVAREQVAKLIGAEPQEIVWTSGATESDNLAITGAARFYQRKGKHIITMATEHPAVLDTCEYLERQGFSVTRLMPESNGLLNLDKFKAAIQPDTILASIMLVNNEIGVIQDIEAIGKITRPNGIILHVDAAQAPGKVAIDVNKMQVDLLSLSGHKVYGPKGIGALYVRQNPKIRLEPLIYGGGHEMGLRSGTLPTHQIVGMGEAFRLVSENFDAEQKRIRKFNQKLWKALKANLRGIQLNGDEKQRVPNNLNILFPGLDAESLMLSMRELAVSTGSACASVDVNPSPVLMALGLSKEAARASARISLGRFTTEDDVDLAIASISKAVRELRELSPVS